MLTCAGKAPPASVQIVKKLSAEFTNINPSWYSVYLFYSYKSTNADARGTSRGFDDFLEMDKVYNFKTLYMGNVPNNDAARVTEGTHVYVYM